MCRCPWEIQQFWHINKINDLVNAAKFEYFLQKYEDYENQVTSTKIRHSKNAYNYYRVWRIIPAEDPDNDSFTGKDCLPEYYGFVINKSCHTIGWLSGWAGQLAGWLISLRHTDGIIQKCWVSMCFINSLLRHMSKMLISHCFYLHVAPSHRWSYSKRMKILGVVNTFEMWFSELFIFR